MRVIGAEYGLAKGTICLTEAADGYYSRPHSLGLVEKASSLHQAAQSGQRSHPMTYRVYEYAGLHWAQGSRGTQLPIEPGKHLSCPRAGSLPHATVMVVTAFWC